VRTLPVLYALQSDSTGELARLLDGELGDLEVERALELLRSSDALDRARHHAGAYVAAAVAALEIYGDAPVVTALTRLAEYAVDRVG
jgi:geranylgeranyl pyrophosphate synthase